jgi:hypothetical protein
VLESGIRRPYKDDTQAGSGRETIWEDRGLQELMYPAVGFPSPAFFFLLFNFFLVVNEIDPLFPFRATGVLDMFLRWVAAVCWCNELGRLPLRLLVFCMKVPKISIFFPVLCGTCSQTRNKVSQELKIGPTCSTWQFTCPAWPLIARY